MDNQERARKFIVEHEGFTWANLATALAAEFDAVAKEARGLISKDSIGGYNPLWKPGQMLVKDASPIRLLSASPVTCMTIWWEAEVWRKGKWIPYHANIVDGCIGYVPYPRVGDTVRCRERHFTPCDSPWPVKDVDHQRGFAQHENLTWHPIENLEPAAPPVETVQTYSESQAEIKSKSVVYGEAPKPTLEGPHWESMWGKHRLAKESMLEQRTKDLREVARDHEERIAKLEKKNG